MQNRTLCCPKEIKQSFVDTLIKWNLWVWTRKNIKRNQFKETKMKSFKSKSVDRAEDGGCWNIIYV